MALLQTVAELDSIYVQVLNYSAAVLFLVKNATEAPTRAKSCQGFKGRLGLYVLSLASIHHESYNESTDYNDDDDFVLIAGVKSSAFHLSLFDLC